MFVFVKTWLFRFLEPKINSLITKRLIQFTGTMVERKEINKKSAQPTIEY